MKKTFCYCLSAMAIASLLLVACDKEESTPAAPTLTVSTASVLAPAEGGSYSFSYTVDNPADDGSVSCTSDVAWITDLDYSTSGYVTFSVSENDTDSARCGDLTLSYTSSNGNAHGTVVVVQNPASVEGTPSISVSTSSVVASKGEGTYSFDYTVTNPADDGTVSCTADADWISDFDYSTEGTVGFSVSKNPESGLRSATITVVYSYSGESVAASVAVVQDYATGFTVEELVGTYTAVGGTAESDTADDGTLEDYTWTIKIYDDEAGGLIIDGLAPYYFGNYPDSKQFVAYGEISNFDFYVTYPTFTNYGNTATRTYYWWVQCPQYNDGWYYSVSSGKCTFVYDADEGTWTSDTGLLYAAASVTSNITSISGLYDGFVPGIVLTKVSDSTDYDPDETTASTSSVKSSHDGLTLHTEVKLAK